MKTALFTPSEASNLIMAACRMKSDSDTQRFLAAAERIFLAKLEAKSETERLNNLKPTL